MARVAPRRRHPRALLALVAVALGLFATGCSSADQDQIRRLALPIPASRQAWYMYHLWHWAWLALIIVGVLVWGLMFYAAGHFRRRSADQVPVQTRYHLPLEILYTVAPVLMVIVFFFFTVKVQHQVQAEDNKTPAATIDVVGQQWSWTFNYVKDPAIGGKTVWESGTTATPPTLWLPVNETVRFNLSSPDVIHSFWVPVFLFKMDVVPGRHNHFSLTPDRIGTFEGRCAELCGVYHSRMLFHVKVVTPAQYAAHLKQLASQPSQVGLNLGGSMATTEAGLEFNGGQ